MKESGWVCCLHEVLNKKQKKPPKEFKICPKSVMGVWQTADSPKSYVIKADERGGGFAGLGFGAIVKSRSGSLQRPRREIKQFPGV